MLEVGSIHRVADKANFYAGRKVRVLECSDWAGIFVAKVELADCAGITFSLRTEKLA